MSEGSIQLRRYLFARREGFNMMSAAAFAPMGLGEARLHEADLAKGLLDHITTDGIPSPHSHRPTEAAADHQTIQRASVNGGWEQGGIASTPMDGPASTNSGETNMARRAKPKDADGGVINVSNAKELVRNAVPRILSLKNDRKAINDEINSLRSEVKAAGIPKSALDLAIRMREIDPEDRAKHDEGYQIARAAIGLQIDMFEDDEAKPARKAKGDAPVVAPDAMH